MYEIKIRNIHKGKSAIEKELAIKKALLCSPKKIMIQQKNGYYLRIFPLFGHMAELSLDSNWRYTDQLTDALFWRKSVKYNIMFRIGSMQIDESGDTITCAEKIEQYIGKILQYRFSHIILDYSDGNNCKKIHMNGRFYKVTQKWSDLNTDITIELEFSADEEDIEIETDNKQ